MAIPSILRVFVVILLPACLCGPAFGAEDLSTPTNAVQYKRADANFYARGDVLKADPGAVILPPTAFAVNGDIYTYTPKKKPQKTVYIEAPIDWVEPITPPDMPASLNIAPDAMQIREPQGDVEVALPNAPTAFAPATNGMILPNGAVVKTGANATAAILFGGVDSARLMPDSEAAVQQAVASTSRAAEVDLTAGGVFSKVGTQVGVEGDYQVHTPYGAVLAQGGDFATYTTANRVDVWVSQGAVELLQPDGKKFGTASGDGTGPLKLIRYPGIADSAESLKADVDSLTSILNFIPVANQKLAALHAKAAQGTALTPNEQAYQQRIKQVPALIKLAIEVPPPSQLTVMADGTVSFQGAPLSLVELGPKLKDFTATAYQPSLVVTAGTGATYANFEAAMKAVKDAGVPHVTTEGTIPAPPPAPPKPQNVVVGTGGMVKLNGVALKLDDFTAKLKTIVAAAPDVQVTVRAESESKPSVTAATQSSGAVQVTARFESKTSFTDLTAVIDACKGVPVKNLTIDLPKLTELTVSAHQDGTIGFHGATMNLDTFSADLKAAIALFPDLPVALHSNPAMDYTKFKAVADACNAVGARQVTVVQPAPQPPPPPSLKVLVQAGGSIKFQDASLKLDEFTTKFKDALAATPDAPVTIHADAKANLADVSAVIDAAKADSPKNFNVALPPAKELSVTVHGDSSILFHGATVSADAFANEVKAAVALYPDAPIVVHSNPKADYTKFQAVVDACHATSAKEVTVVQPAPQPPKPVVATPPPMPPTAETPPTPAPAPVAEKPAAPAQPLSVIAHQDGTIKFQGKTMKIDEFTAKIKDAVTANPDLAVIIHSNPKMDYAKFQAVVDACKNAPAKEVDVVPPAPQPKPAPLPVTAETPPTPVATPTPPAPVNNKPVPAEIDLAVDGSLKLDGSAVTEDDLKARLTDIKATNPKNPLVMMKEPGVKKEQWTHYVDLCHSMGLKLLVKNAKAPALVPMAATPPTLRPSAAEGGSTVTPPPAVTPTPEATTPATSAPGTISSTEEAVPVEIELTPDGQVSFLGEAVSDADLKARLDGVAQSNSKEPVLIVKDEKVSHEQLEHVVDLCHAAKLKVKVKTVKSSDSGALKPHAQLPVALEPAPGIGSGGEKTLPVEIGLASKGRLTFEGTPVSLDELKSRLATVAQGNPDQPVVIMKNSDVSDDSADALVTVCQGVSSQLKVSVKTAPTFTVPAPPVSTTSTGP